MGRYLNLLEAQSTDERLRSRGGGGIVTSLLVHMMETGIISKALVIGSSAEPPWARPVLATSVNEIYAASGSKYQFVPYGSLARHLDENSAVVGLPCQISSLRKKPIGLKIGLFCGINLSWRGICYLLRHMKVKIDEIRTVDYRAPGGGLPVCLQDGRSVRYGPYSWLAYFFSYNRCLKCTDHTNHYADVSVGDRRAGWSNVIIRSKKGMEVFESAVDAECIVAKKLCLEDFLSKITTPLVQKECLGGYAKDPFVRVWGRWIESVPMCMLHLFSQQIMRRHIKQKANIIDFFLEQADL